MVLSDTNDLLYNYIWKSHLALRVSETSESMISYQSQLETIFRMQKTYA